MSGGCVSRAFRGCAAGVQEVQRGRWEGLWLEGRSPQEAEVPVRHAATLVSVVSSRARGRPTEVEPSCIELQGRGSGRCGSATVEFRVGKGEVAGGSEACILGYVSPQSCAVPCSSRSRWQRVLPRCARAAAAVAAAAASSGDEWRWSKGLPAAWPSMTSLVGVAASCLAEEWVADHRRQAPLPPPPSPGLFL